MKRTALIWTATLLTLALLAGCSGSSSSQSTAASAAPASAQTAPASTADSTTDTAASSSTAASASGELVLTVEELSAYNGKDGQPAYVAVDGVIYDVTDVPQWANGEHYSGLVAGKDLTVEIKEQSPHGLSVLDGLPVVGTLAA